MQCPHVRLVKLMLPTYAARHGVKTKNVIILRSHKVKSVHHIDLYYTAKVLTSPFHVTNEIYRDQIDVF